ncbi:MAG: TetR/AcrR family transcriptional regulator [Syntrophobacteraceae bacterium]
MSKRSSERDEALPSVPSSGDAAAMRIVAAARRRFYALGFRRVTMDDLAEELGMSKKTLYAHFPGKKALVEAVILNKLQHVEADLNRVTSDLSGDFLPLFRELVATMLMHIEEIQPPFMQDIRHEAELFGRVERGRGELIQRYFGRLLREGQQTGVVRKDIPAGVIMEVLLGAVRTIMNPARLAELDITPRAGITAILGIILEGVVTEEGRVKQ